MKSRLQIGSQPAFDRLIGQHFERVQKRADSFVKLFERFRKRVGLAIRPQIERSIGQLERLGSQNLLLEHLRKLARRRESLDEKILMRRRLVTMAQKTPHYAVSRGITNLLSGWCKNSWAETVNQSQEPLVGIYDDPFEESYLKAFAAGQDRWKRDRVRATKNGLEQDVCSALEGNLIRAHREHSTLVIVDDKTSAVWLVKHPFNGDYGDWATLVNLNTGEVYTPGSELFKWTAQKLRPFTLETRVVSLNDLEQEIGTENLRLHFARLIAIVSVRFSRFRIEVMEKYGH